MPVPPPLAQWVFHPSRLRDGELVAVVGPNLKVSGFPREKSGGLKLEGPWDAFTYPWYQWNLWPDFPKSRFTIDLLLDLTLQSEKEPMGLVGCTFTNESDGARGWSMLWEKEEIVFKLATPLGKSQARVKNVPRRKPIALTACYDQQELTMFLNGVKVATTEAMLGTLTLNGRTPFAIGGWWQGDRTYGFGGTVYACTVYSAALTESQVAELAATRLPGLDSLPPLEEPTQISWVIEPTFQQVSADTTWIIWEVSRTTPARVRFGSENRLTRVRSSRPNRIHKVRLADLKPETTYSVQVECGGLTTSIHFTTLPPAEKPVRIAIVGDTQDHPEINHQVALGMRSHSPALGVIVGDLVGAGWQKEQWTDDFFASMRPLWSEVPLFPIPGNHDRNAHLYYALMALPDTQYYYAFRAGAAEIFTLDTEHPVAPGSLQYRWLEQALARSTACWKIVMHHYPPYSSDLDDYGTDLGDAEVRQLCPLYDLYQVDLVFSGHIHSYERTHPLRAGKVVSTGTTYLVVGGGGGDLEQFLPVPPAFSAARLSAHHYGILDISPEQLLFRAFTLDGQEFDSWELSKL